MVRPIISYFTPVPPTSLIETTNEVQQPYDLASTGTTFTSTEGSQNTTYDQGLDWSRLIEYERAPWLHKRPKSWIYTWGWRLRCLHDQKDYWICIVKMTKNTLN
jgi:hypothetical protein